MLLAPLRAQGATHLQYRGRQPEHRSRRPRQVRRVREAGRVAFITGQAPIRTGLTKVGTPGATLGLSAEDPSVAEFLKGFGYATGQFGKNHLGDRNEHLPTVHGFDEFFGNLYHLNAEEEPEYENYPEGPSLSKEVRSARRHAVQGDRQGRCDRRRAIRKSRQADHREHRAANAQAHGDGGRGIPRRGPGLHGAQDKGRRALVLLLQSDPHARVHPPEGGRRREDRALAVPTGWSSSTVTSASCCRSSTTCGVADNTIVVFTTDNGAEVLSWPDGGATPFRGEKDTNWEGGWRVPCVMRWPGSSSRPCHQRHLLAAGLHSHVCRRHGEPALVEKVKKGYKIGDKTFKVHLTASTCCRSSRAGRRNARAKASSTGATTAT